MCRTNLGISFTDLITNRELLKCVDSLLLASDLALEKGDYSCAQILTLRLIGFLDSRGENECLILPIRLQALSILHAARTCLVTHSDR